MSCEYIIKRGKEKGNECSEDVYKNSRYCSKHYKQNSKNTVFDDILNTALKLSSKNKSDDDFEFLEDDNGKYVNNKGYVVNCPEEKIIIGKLNNQGELNYLTNEDLEWCINNKILYERFI